MFNAQFDVEIVDCLERKISLISALMFSRNIEIPSGLSMNSLRPRQAPLTPVVLNIQLRNHRTRQFNHSQMLNFH